MVVPQAIPQEDIHQTAPLLLLVIPKVLPFFSFPLPLSYAFEKGGGGPGFWGGMATGGLLGYLGGRGRHNYGYNAYGGPRVGGYSSGGMMSRLLFLVALLFVLFF